MNIKKTEKNEIIVSMNLRNISSQVAFWACVILFHIAVNEGDSYAVFYGTAAGIFLCLDIASWYKSRKEMTSKSIIITKQDKNKGGNK